MQTCLLGRLFMTHMTCDDNATMLKRLRMENVVYTLIFVERDIEISF